MNVLFVDDRKDRLSRIQAARPDDNIEWASTTAEAVILLGQSITDPSEAGARPPYDEIWLDYHLGSADADGETVANVLACLSKHYAATPIKLHTTTRYGAVKMQYVLAKAGFDDTRIKCFEDIYPAPIIKYEVSRTKVGKGQKKLAHYGANNLPAGYVLLPDNVVEWDGPEELEPGLESWRLPYDGEPLLRPKGTKYRRAQYLYPDGDDRDIPPQQWWLHGSAYHDGD